jgi:predicted acyltransferase
VKRSLALDVFRGLTVALMILVNNPGSWSHVYAPFLHAPWHGLTPTDLVFPFFLFAVGNAQALVFPPMWETNTQGYFFKKLWKRSLIIFLIGFFLNWFPFAVWIGDDLKLRTWSWMNAEGVEVGIRVMGVLQRIALAYGFSGLLCYLWPKKILSLSLALLMIYWIICVLLGSGDIYSLEGWFGTGIDKAVFGSVHLYQGEGTAFDPEGLMSTIPAIAQVMLGFWAGRFLAIYNPRKSWRSLRKRGLILLALGSIWHFIHPVNKKIWTGSYVLVTTGMAILILLILVKLLDEKKYRSKLTYFFEAFGKNPLFIFVLSALIPKSLGLIRIPYQDKFITPLQWLYENVCTSIPGPPENGSLFYSLVLIFFYGLLAIWLDKKKTYIKV